MMKKRMVDALNEQIKNEFYSAYLYLGMSSYFYSLNLMGFSKWLDIQAKEELGHGMKILKFLEEQSAKVELKAIDASKTNWESPLTVFKAALAHEQEVTEMINQLVELADKEQEHAAFSFLQWFVNEQVEEEANASEIVAKLEMAKDDSGCLITLDHYYGKREA